MLCARAEGSLAFVGGPDASVLFLCKLRICSNRNKQTNTNVHIHVCMCIYIYLYHSSYGLCLDTCVFLELGA